MKEKKIYWYEFVIMFIAMFGLMGFGLYLMPTENMFEAGISSHETTIRILKVLGGSTVASIGFTASAAYILIFKLNNKNK